ncbi:MAG TPA: hypothetical protein VK049_04525 [Paenalcaligenes sp.]|nr:hypothetical protein [Paenalcaligenes sp.]
MVTNASVTAIFAESIRKESSGQYTIVGAFEDVAEFSTRSQVLPQLAVHATLSTLVENPFIPIKIRLRWVNGKTLMEKELPEDLKEQQMQAHQKRSAGEKSGWLYLRVKLSLTGIEVSDGGRLVVELENVKGLLVSSNALCFKINS